MIGMFYSVVVLVKNCEIVPICGSSCQVFFHSKNFFERVCSSFPLYWRGLYF